MKLLLSALAFLLVANLSSAATTTCITAKGTVMTFGWNPYPASLDVFMIQPKGQAISYLTGDVTQFGTAGGYPHFLINDYPEVGSSTYVNLSMNGNTYTIKKTRPDGMTTSDNFDFNSCNTKQTTLPQAEEPGGV